MMVDACLVNGVIQAWKSREAYIDMGGAQAYNGGEIIKGPGDFSVQVHDEDGTYGDNSGDLYFVAYPAD
jgi:hypothetical protein